MDPEETYLGRMLVEEITPAVMVLLTPMVEEACQKNGLNFVQMLSPFCLFNKIDVPVRTASDQPYRLQMFKLRLVYASDIRQENVMVANEHLKQVVSNASEEAFSDSQSDSPHTETMLNIAESKPQPSWFQNFNKELLRSLSFSDHEAFDHPVACLLVVSSKDEHPINKFVDLFNTDQLPSLLNEGAMDPKILKYYLLVHDNQDGNSEKATNILAEMRSTFGSSDCGLLCINSVNGVVERTDNMWAPYKNDSSLHSDIGCFLSLDDHNEMKDFMQDLSSKHIIPHMEQKVRVLNQQFFHCARYTFSSLESQIRVLGDYAFMLRDYELALSNYRLLSSDYKLDKAWKRYAGVQEMIGLSYFMLDQSRKEAEYCMENAFNTYLKIGSSGKRYATRCGLWWAEMLKAWGLYREAASVYFCISNEEPRLHAAVFLEQSSYCYLFSKPPMLRKYGFHLVLAGSRYDLSDQRKHAIRTYKSALSVYKGSAWNYINDIVHFNIGRWHSFLGVYDVAIKHMLEVLACAHQPLPTQQLFLSEFLHTVQSIGKTYEVHGLQLPVINMLSLKVIYEDHRTYASSTAVHIKESLWQSLEEDMVPVVPTTRTNWLESLPKSSKKYSGFCICVTGEAIKVHLEFKNPLRTSISLSSVSLVCELSARSTGMQSGNQSGHDLDGHRSTTDHQDNEELFISNSEQNSSKSAFILSEIDFALQGGEAMMVELSVTPKMEGILNIFGVRWTLSGSVVGYHNFKPDLNEKKHKKGRNLSSSSSRNLKFVVVKSLPKLDGCLHHIPKKAYAGDLRLLVLELKNQSKFSVKNLKMKISHPRYLIPGRLKDMDVEFPACLQKQISRECSDAQTNIVEKPNGLLFSFPEDATIQGGTPFFWPLWLHAGSSGSTSLYLSIYYEMENSSSDMSYRTLRMHYNLEVLPSLDVAVQITPSSRLQDFLVRMDITNRTNSECFWLQQLSSVGYQWKISSLSPDVSICPSQLLLAGQALSCFFKLKDYVKSVTTEGTDAAPDMDPENDVSLGSQGKHEALLDITRSPLADFHRHERSHFEKSIQNCLSTVDFILLSQPQEDETNIEPRGLLGSPRLYSHHKCLCSIGGVSPILWLMNGPQTVEHDFSVSFCEIRLRMTIRSYSDVAAVVKIHAFDSVETNQQLSDGVQSYTSGNQPGWHSISISNDLKVLTNFQETQSGQPPSQSISSFVWSASSSTQVLLKPMSTAEIPLQICIFSPGNYDLSNYAVHWSLQLSDAEGYSAIGATRQSSGTVPGHPYYLTAMQSP